METHTVQYVTLPSSRRHAPTRIVAGASLNSRTEKTVPSAEAETNRAPRVRSLSASVCALLAVFAAMSLPETTNASGQRRPALPSTNEGDTGSSSHETDKGTKGDSEDDFRGFNTCGKNDDIFLPFGWCTEGRFYGPLFIGDVFFYSVLEKGFYGLLQVSLLAIHDDGPMFHVGQIGLVSTSHGSQYGGVQVGILGARSTRFNGLLQLGVLYSKVDTFRGVVQAGAVTDSKDFAGGVQVGILNIAKEFVGVSMVAIVNWSESVKGMQIGLFNRTRTISGLQFGVVNTAVQVYGVQLGVFNYLENGVVPYTLLLNGGF